MSEAPTALPSPLSSAKPPIIVIGMHRSGTSLLTRMLDSLGLFVGWRLAPNHEAGFFNHLNSWLLASSGGRWDTPTAIDYLLDDRPARELAGKYLRQRLSSPLALEFLGPRRYVTHRSLFNLAEPWGWKDPRTTVTLPLWLELFPQAQVIHLVRNGVDVAESLYRRQSSGFTLARQNYDRYRLLFHWLPKRGWFGTSPRLTRREQAFQLWEEHLDYASRWTAGLGPRLLELQYESLLMNPRDIMPQVLNFCGLEPSPEVLDKELTKIRSDRAFSFQAEPELKEFWQGVRERPWMQKYGYDVLQEPS